jgi:hypothetical protein
MGARLKIFQETSKTTPILNILCFGIEDIRYIVDSHRSQQSTIGDSEMEEEGKNAGLDGSFKSTHHHSHQPSCTGKIRSAMPNKPSEKKVRERTGNKVTSRRINEDERWKDSILSRIIRFEHRLGRKPTLVDILNNFRVRGQHGVGFVSLVVSRFG